MAEKRSEKVTVVSPLYSTGVGHVEVRSWRMGTPPDPLGILDPTGATCPEIHQGGGDAVNDWADEFPDGNY